MNLTLFGQRGFTSVVKDLEMRRSSWIFQAGSRCNEKNTYKGEADG